MRNVVLGSLLYSSIVTLVFLFVVFNFDNHFDLDNVQLLSLAVLCFCVSLFVFGICFLYLKKHFFTPSSQKEHEIQALKTLEKYRREFFGNVSHELKTPIFNIQGYVETLIDGALYDKAVNKKYLKRTSKSIDRLMYIIKDLESISQLESEELKLEFTTWNLQHLINEVIEQFEIKAQKKKIKFLHDEQSTDVLVFADKVKLGQVLSNLFSNSIKYGKKNGVTKISCHQTKKICYLSIKDNGIGVSKKNVNRLFERFYRVDKSRSREQGGTGLGLAIVKHIIEAHNQQISVKSELGKGTDFKFTIKCG